MILVIDDSKTIRSLLKEYLTKLGYSVLVADNGETGIELYHSVETVDAVLTDIDMPVMNGNRVARHIRSQKKRSPILAVTGSDESLIEVELFDRILKKPIRMNELKSALAAIM